MWWGKRTFVVHLGGVWGEVNPGAITVNDHSGGRRRNLTLDGDELMYMDFMKDIQDFMPRGKKVSSVTCILAGFLCPLGTDKQLMHMWESIMVENDYKYHLFVAYDDVVGLTQNWEENPSVMGVNQRKYEPSFRSILAVQYKSNIPTESTSNVHVEFISNVHVEPISNVHVQAMSNKHDNPNPIVQSTAESLGKIGSNLFQKEQNQERVNIPKVGQLVKGMEWRTMEECRKFFKSYGIDNTFSFKHNKNDKKRFYFRHMYKNFKKEFKVTNNFSESFNAWILKIRDKPLLHFIDKYIKAVMSLIHERRLLFKEMKEGDLVTFAIEVITKLEKKHNRYKVDGFDNDKYCATDPKSGKHFVVDLIAKTCSCMVWQLGGIPCVHAIAVIRPLSPSRESWSKWCSPYFHVEAFKGTYAGSIYPFDNEEDWGKLNYEDQYLPPPVERKARIPKKQRIRDEDEERASSTRKCKLCNNLGHNQITCPERPNK
ncbi:hypothetical protein IFM89_028262 [Coptis chinensis]|uniref:SWIM-type domain-containing protein n=1 Tax=Coptis chinensis TaxID=261450 RepID=A0A835HI57_9MAGN|nr:hypothetical protein IFM89_028262 [Coptis chinensis]